MEICETDFTFKIFIAAAEWCLSVCVMEMFAVMIMVLRKLTPIKFDLS